MDLFSMLPLLQGWDYHVESFASEDKLGEPKQVVPGQEGVIVRDDPSRGWIISAVVTVSTLWARLRINGDKGVYEIEASPYDLLGLGATRPTAFWLSRYGKLFRPRRATFASTATAEAMRILASSFEMPCETSRSNVWRVSGGLFARN